MESWEQQSILEIGELGIKEVAAFEDCPELFELPIDGDLKHTKWILYAGSGDYVLGEFDGKRFIPESDLIRYNYGDCFYASQTFNNLPKEDGRRIQMAWGTVDFPGMPFNQMMTFPVELNLRNTPEGVRMFANPVREIEHLYKEVHTWKDLLLEPDQNILDGISGRLLDIQVEFTPKGASDVGLVIQGMEINYHVETQNLSSLAEKAELRPEGGRISLRILVDIRSAEVFGNRGRIYMPLQTETNPEKNSPRLYSAGGNTMIHSLVVRELAPIWR